MAKTAVIGGGSWGTALVNLLAKNGNQVHWWVRSAEMAAHIRKFRQNPLYLSYLSLNEDNIEISNNLEEIIGAAEVLIFAVPSAFLEGSLGDIRKEVFRDKYVVSAIKGMIPSSNQLIGDFFQDRYDVPISNFGVIGGPSHSEEVAMEKLSYLTLAMKNEEVAQRISASFTNRFLIMNHSTDIVGIEYASLLKNIYAIASGLAVGLGYGDNFQAVLVSNAMIEMDNFLNSINEDHRNVNMSPYTGDLLVTCYSHFSRNRTFGNMLGQGYTVKVAQLEMRMIAEGYYASSCLNVMKAGFDVDTPIADTVYNICYLGHSPSLEMRTLTQGLK